MQQIIEQFLQFLQQGIATIFRFVQLIWTWSSEQITKMMAAPWVDWPLWKQLVLIVIVAAVAFVLFLAARYLWAEGFRVLAAFVGFLRALVYTLPMILLAGFIALAGLWVINNFNPSSLSTLTVFGPGASGPGIDSDHPAAETVGQSQRKNPDAK